MIMNEATVKSNHRPWPLLNLRKGQFIVPRFWSHGRQLAVVTQTGATPVHTGAEAKTQVLYICEFNGKIWRDFNSLLINAKDQKNAASPLKFPKDFRFRGNWDEDLL